MCSVAGCENDNHKNTPTRCWTHRAKKWGDVIEEKVESVVEPAVVEEAVEPVVELSAVEETQPIIPSRSQLVIECCSKDFLTDEELYYIEDKINIVQKSIKSQGLTDYRSSPKKSDQHLIDGYAHQLWVRGFDGHGYEKKNRNFSHYFYFKSSENVVEFKRVFNDTNYAQYAIETTKLSSREQGSLDCNSDHHIDLRLFKLCCMINRSWFRDQNNLFNLAGMFCRIEHVDKTMTRRTYACILMMMTSSEYFDMGVALRVFDKWMTEKYHPKIDEAKLKAIAGGNNPEEYRKWREEYEPKEMKVKKVSKRSIEEQELENKEAFIESVRKELRIIDRSLIRQDNGIEYEDFLEMNEDVVLNAQDLAMMIRKVIVRTSNEGDYLYYAKRYSIQRYRRQEVKYIDFVSINRLSLNEYLFYVEFEGETLTLKLSQILSGVKNDITFRKCEVAPYGAFDDNAKNTKMFNLFGGFLHTYDANFIVDNDLVMLWVNHIKDVWACGDETLFQYLLKYFTHILVNPMVKTGVVILLKGVQGAGKNLPIDIYIRYVIGPSLGCVVPDLERVVGRFNSIRQSKLMCVLDEAVDNKNKIIVIK